MYVYTGIYDATVPSDYAAIHGERCTSQTLTSINAATSSTSSSSISTLGADGDTCLDVRVSPGDMVETTLTFADALSVPCTDYGTGDGQVKLQICSSSRSMVDDSNCDAIGPHPCDPIMCYCDTIDVPGVTILDESMGVPTCEPTPETTVEGMGWMTPVPTLPPAMQATTPYPTTGGNVDIVPPTMPPVVGVPTPEVDVPSVPTPYPTGNAFPSPTLPPVVTVANTPPPVDVPTGVFATPYPTESNVDIVPPTMPPVVGVPTPEVTTPSVPTPEMPTPGVPTPEVTTPSVPTPDVTTPSAPTPEVPTPSVPTPPTTAMGSTVRIIEISPIFAPSRL